MLNTTENTGFIVNSKETGSKIDGNSLIGNSVIGGSEVINLKNPTNRKNQAKITKSKNLVKSKTCGFPLNSRNIEAR